MTEWLQVFLYSVAYLDEKPFFGKSLYVWRQYNSLPFTVVDGLILTSQ